jgi:hypothetical protein
MDAHGRVIEVVEESRRGYIKMVFQYDEAGRQTEIANYSRSGNLIRKCVTEYQIDVSGNWTEEKDFDWDLTLDNKPLRLRTIGSEV